MGYSTDFTGSLTFNKPVTEELKTYIHKFSTTRRMKRDNEKIKKLFPDWKSKCFNGELGINGEYFIGGKGFAGQGEDDSILEYNHPSRTQPGLWCDWEINDDGELVWNETEKFYHYTEWLVYLIENFFKPEGYVLNGILSYQGEDPDDYGEIVVVNNEVDVLYGDCDEIELSNLDDNDLIKELERRGYKVS